MSLLLPRPPLPGCEDGGSSASAYLVSYGTSGAFGRFVPARPLGLRRGDRVVIETPRGLELGTVLCPAGAAHARLLNQHGPLLRPATPEDLTAADSLDALRQRLFEDCAALARELNLGVEILDVEVLLEGRKAVVQFLGSADPDLAPLVNELADRHELLMFFENAALPVDVPVDVPDEEHGGCGEPGCGRAKGGSGCSSCGSGGCSSCGAGKVDMRAYFAHLRTQMENQRRVPLA